MNIATKREKKNIFVINTSFGWCWVKLFLIVIYGSSSSITTEMWNKICLLLWWLMVKWIVDIKTNTICTSFNSFRNVECHLICCCVPFIPKMRHETLMRVQFETKIMNLSGSYLKMINWSVVVFRTLSQTNLPILICSSTFSYLSVYWANIFFCLNDEGILYLAIF